VAMSSAVAHTIPIAVLWTYSSTSLLSQGAHCHALLIYTQLKLRALKLHHYLHGMLTCLMQQLMYWGIMDYVTCSNSC
jgi:hypothetical protein